MALVVRCWLVALCGASAAYPTQSAHCRHLASLLIARQIQRCIADTPNPVSPTLLCSQPYLVHALVILPSDVVMSSTACSSKPQVCAGCYPICTFVIIREIVQRHLFLARTHALTHSLTHARTHDLTRASSNSIAHHLPAMLHVRTVPAQGLVRGTLVLFVLSTTHDEQC